MPVWVAHLAYLKRNTNPITMEIEEVKRKADPCSGAESFDPLSGSARQNPTDSEGYSHDFGVSDPMEGIARDIRCYRWGESRSRLLGKTRL
jgi:hypothetical protein